MNKYNKQTVGSALPLLAKLPEKIAKDHQELSIATNNFDEKIKRACSESTLLLSKVEGLKNSFKESITKWSQVAEQPVRKLDEVIQLMIAKLEAKNAKNGKSHPHNNEDKKTVKDKSAPPKKQDDRKTQKKQLVESIVDDKLSHLQLLREATKLANMPAKFFCACKGKKGLTFGAYIDHMFVCHNNVVPEGSSHNLDGTVCKRQAFKNTSNIDLL